MSMGPSFFDEQHKHHCCFVPVQKVVFHLMKEDVRFAIIKQQTFDDILMDGMIKHIKLKPLQTETVHVSYEKKKHDHGLEFVNKFDTKSSKEFNNRYQKTNKNFYNCLQVETPIFHYDDADLCRQKSLMRKSFSAPNLIDELDDEHENTRTCLFQKNVLRHFGRSCQNINDVPLKNDKKKLVEHISVQPLYCDLLHVKHGSDLEEDQDDFTEKSKVSTCSKNFYNDDNYSLSTRNPFYYSNSEINRQSRIVDGSIKQSTNLRSYSAQCIPSLPRSLDDDMVYTIKRHDDLVPFESFMLRILLPISRKNIYPLNFLNRNKSNMRNDFLDGIRDKKLILQPNRDLFHVHREDIRRQKYVLATVKKSNKR